MAFLDLLNPVFDVLFGWLLPLDPFWSILILSFIISLIIIVITKYTTKQDLMKHLKEESKELQKQMKELKDKPEKMMEVQKKHMESSMKYMRESFRPLLWTFVPIILIFGWMSSNLAYEPIMPGQEFSVRVQLEKGITGTITASSPEGIELTSEPSKEVSDGIAIFTFKALEPGTYAAPGLTFTVNNKGYTKDVLVTNERKYLTPLKNIRDRTVRSIETIHDKVQVIRLGTFSLSWLWSYIIFSIIFSSALRKLMKVY
jgi:uncharacterized membrane protein (DUF106 family)